MVVCGVNTLLHDTASVHVASNLVTVGHHSVIDELFVLCRPADEYLLYHVIAVDFSGKWYEVAHQVLSKKLLLGRVGEDLYDSLD